MKTNYIVLCHKCSGLLTQATPAIKQAFGGCGCISGYVRDWQTALTIQRAINEAIAHHEHTIKWLTGRNASGDTQSIVETQARIETLRQFATTIE